MQNFTNFVINLLKQNKKVEKNSKNFYVFLIKKRFAAIAMGKPMHTTKKASAISVRLISKLPWLTLLKGIIAKFVTSQAMSAIRMLLNKILRCSNFICGKNIKNIAVHANAITK